MPAFVTPAMKLKKDLDGLYDMDLLESAMRESGEWGNAWYQDWFTTLNALPESEWYVALDAAATLNKKCDTPPTEKDERLAMAFKQRLDTQALESLLNERPRAKETPEQRRARSSGAPWEDTDSLKRKQNFRSSLAWVLTGVSLALLYYAFIR